MKIIGGEFRGRQIDMPRGVDIRPTPDRVREAIFNIIRERISGASVLDLFAGSGALGIEAVSRGAASLFAVDINRKCVSTIRKNIRSLSADAGRRIDIRQADALKTIKKLSDSKIRFDLVFLDPPYYSEWVKKCLISLSNYDILKHSSLVICEHFKKDAVPEEIRVFKTRAQKRYGDTVVSIYEKSSVPGVV